MLTSKAFCNRFIWLIFKFLPVWLTSFQHEAVTRRGKAKQSRKQGRTHRLLLIVLLLVEGGATCTWSLLIRLIFFWVPDTSAFLAWWFLLLLFYCYLAKGSDCSCSGNTVNCCRSYIVTRCSVKVVRMWATLLLLLLFSEWLKCQGKCKAKK